MKQRFIIAAALSITLCFACGKTDLKPANKVSRAEPSTAPTVSIPKDGNYNGTGRVTKIDLKLGSVELDHKEIVGVMPAMRMEFYVKDKAQLENLRIGDETEFVLEYRQGTEKITNIKVK